MILVIVSSTSEWNVLMDAIGPRSPGASPYGAWFEHEAGGVAAVMLNGGWGKIAAAASAQYAIDRWHPTALLNIGTCGGLAPRVRAGDLILVERAVVSDMVVEIGSQEDEEAFYATILTPLDDLESRLPWPVLRGTIASGDRDVGRHDVARLIECYGAIAADWESASIAFVARRNTVPCVILRGVSDVVGAGHADAYDGRDHVFHAGADAVMRTLLGGLPDLLRAMVDLFPA